MDEALQLLYRQNRRKGKEAELLDVVEVEVEVEQRTPRQTSL